jgi:hypothetical protein
VHGGSLISVFLGAGFSILGAVPLASQLFAEEPKVDGVTRERLVERVLCRWRKWHARTKGTPEQYLAELEAAGGQAWHDAVWYVSLVIALRMGKVDSVGGRLKIIKHNLDRTSGVQPHERFWDSVFSATKDVAVITTNYDILAERGMRNAPRKRIPRPGFNYGSGNEELLGGGYPSYAHIQRVSVSGTVPLLKLHGSVSWALGTTLRKYHDCRPSIKGEAAIIAPVTDKCVPQLFSAIWAQAAQALSKSERWIVVGYSFPDYDVAVNKLFASNSAHRPTVNLFNPDPAIASRVRLLLPQCDICAHPGLPAGLEVLGTILSQPSDR